MSDRRSSNGDLARRLEKIIAAAPVVVYAFSNGEGEPEPLWVCPNVTRIMGHPLERTYSPDWWRDVVHPDDLPQVRHWRQECLKGQTGVLEYRVLHGDGSYRWVRDELRHPNGSGDPELKGVGSWMDVTERRLLTEQLLEAQKMDAVGRLAGGVAHDFNNLLTVILSHATLLKDHVQPSNPAREDVEGILSAAARASELTSQLLSFGRKQLLAPEAVELDPRLREMTPVLERLLGEAVEVELSLGAEGSAVWADPGRLKQAVVNLALNARDAMPDGGGLTISTGTTEVEGEMAEQHQLSSGPYAFLQLRDTGVGMSEEVRSRACEPFFTTKEQGRGTGLGLAMVHGFVKQSGGALAIESAPSVGTEVTLYLPLAAPEGAGS